MHAAKAAEPAALVDPALRDPQSFGIPVEFHSFLEIDAIPTASTAAPTVHISDSFR